MHLTEGILPAAQALAWTAVSAPLVAWSARGAAQDPAARSRLGVATALTFATTLLPIPVPGLGATSHMCATPFLALLLGPRALALPVTLSLLVQALLFAHGGLSTLGANVFTLGLAAPWLTHLLAQGLRQLRVPGLLAAGLACAVGAASVYALDAMLLALALAGTQPFGHWFRLALLAFAPVQGPLLLLEGILSALLLGALARRRAAQVPDWLRKAGPAALGLLLLAGGTSLQAHGHHGKPKPAAAAPADAATPSAQAGTPSTPPSVASDPGGPDAQMDAAARAAGRRPEPWIDLTQGELGLFLFMGGGLVAGFLLGRHWERLRPEPSAAPRP